MPDTPSPLLVRQSDSPHRESLSRDLRVLRRTSRYLPAAIGVVVLLAGWELAALTILAHRYVLPTPDGVVAQLWKDRGLYAENLPTTLIEAGEGWLGGNAAALLFAILLVQLPLLEKELVRIAVAAYCMPIVAIGPILEIVFTGTAPKAILAGLAVFFTTFVAAVLGLRSADQSILDVITVYGGGRWQQIRKVRLIGALPATFGGLQIAAPAAVLGALIGEYFGGSTGIGVAMIISEQSLEVARTWGLAIVATAVAGIAYALTGLIGRRLTPWMPRKSSEVGLGGR